MTLSQSGIALRQSIALIDVKGQIRYRSLDATFLRHRSTAALAV
jgi:hypothetical protein